jgi:TPR repeat protein
MNHPLQSVLRGISLVAAAILFGSSASVLPAQSPLDPPDFSPSREGLDAGLKAAYEAHQEGRYQEAFTAASETAGKGLPETDFFLGWLHETGRGTQQDFAAALASYEKAQEAGYVPAAYRRCRLLLNGDEGQKKQAGEILTKLSETEPGRAGLVLGEAFATGLLGEEPDYDEAVKWWTKAADEGESVGFINLARLREQAFGFPEKADNKAALEYLKRAADLDDPIAMAALGSRYLNGAEEIRDEQKGIEWLTRAAEEKIPEASLVLGEYESDRQNNYAKAREYYQAAADGGNVSAHIKLGTLHQNALGGEQSTEKALDLFKKAASRGSAEGAHYAATLMLAAQDEEKVVENIIGGYRFLLAAAGQRTSAQIDLANLYLSGRLGVADSVSAAAWLDRAARLGDPVARANLGALYESGTGVQRSPKAAFQLYNLAMQQGNLAAMRAVGRFHATGAAGEMNLPEAWALLTLAAERGDKESKTMLSQLTTQMGAEEVMEGSKRLEELKNPPKDESPAGASGGDAE